MKLPKKLACKLKMVTFLCIALVATSNYSQAEEAIWTPKTTLKVKGVSHVDVSPDGTEVVYAVTEVKIEDELNEYRTQIWKAKVDDLQSSTPLTSKQYATFPR